MVPKAASIGHLAAVTPFFGDLFDNTNKEVELFIKAIDFDAIARWIATDESECHRAAKDLFAVVIGHHGKPVVFEAGHARKTFKRHWETQGEYAPLQCLIDLVEQAKHWFPLAFSEENGFLPDSPEFQHALAGVFMLADWLGSDENFFPYDNGDASNCIVRARERAKKLVAGIPLNVDLLRPSIAVPVTFTALFPKLTAPKPMQEKILDAPISSDGSLLLLEAETGAGKTEAALARFFQLFSAGVVDGLYFALPTRTAATQLHRRVQQAVKEIYGENGPKATLAVPGYCEADGETSNSQISLCKEDNLHCEEESSQKISQYQRWASEGPKRFLASCIAVGTIDQVLLSALQVKHAHMRASCLARVLLVVDEVHASDTYMTKVLEEVINFHVCQCKSHALLMSATLACRATQAWEKRLFLQEKTIGLQEAINIPYPRIKQWLSPFSWYEENLSQAQKNIEIELWEAIDNPQSIAEKALNAAKAGAKVLVLRNTVGAAIATQKALDALAIGCEELLFSLNGIATLHHARFSAEDRTALDGALEAFLGKARKSGGGVAVTTQTAQQSLDIDCDLLITDLCPMDVLLQRIGRLHRHTRENRPKGFEQAKIFVLSPAEGQLLAWAEKEKGPHGFGTVYEELLPVEATRQLLFLNKNISIPTDNRRLVEGAFHEEALENICAIEKEWSKHRQTARGIECSKRQLGGDNSIRRKTPYSETQFLEDVKIPTRLGEGDWLVPLDDFNLLSCFGINFKQLRIPAFLAKGLSSKAKPENVTGDSNKITFRLEGRYFCYNRFGLQTTQPEESQEDDDA